MSLFEKQVNYDDMPDWANQEVSTGTTIMAAAFNGGVIIGADSRTTTGTYIANRATNKLTKVTDKIYCCRAGRASDTQAVADVVSYHLDLQTIELGSQPLVITAANLFKDLCYNYRESIIASIIVAGYDDVEGGQVYAINLGGMCHKKDVVLGGSGSRYLYGYVDSNYKPGMTKEECMQFVTNAVYLATERDASSGGVVRLGIITKDGVENRLIAGKNLPKFN